MLAFITSLRHPANSSSYAEVERLLEATLTSVARQDCDDYVIIVVGHQPPNFVLPPKTVFVPVEFDPPARVTGPHADRSGFVFDKGTKMAVGLAAAKVHSPTHVMIFDADDFVSRRLAGHAAGHTGTHGWVLNHGVMYSSRRNCWRFVDDFNKVCGTSFIVPFDAYAVPDNIHVGSGQDEIAKAYGDRLERILGAHKDADLWFADHDVTLHPLPFPGAGYHVDTGENHSGAKLRGIARPLNRAVSHELGIDATRSVMGTLRSAMSPRAVAQSLRAAARSGRAAYQNRRRGRMR